MKNKVNFRITTAILSVIILVTIVLTGLPLKKADAINLAPDMPVSNTVYYFSDMYQPTISVSELECMTNDYCMIVYNDSAWEYILTNTTQMSELDAPTVRDKYLMMLEIEFNKIFDLMNNNSGILSAEYGTGTLDDPKTNSCIIVLELVNHLAAGNRLAELFQYLSMTYGHRIIFLSGYSLDAYGDEAEQEYVTYYLDKFYKVYDYDDFFEDVFNDYTSNYADIVYNGYENAEIYLDSNLVPYWNVNMSLSDAYNNEPSIRRIVDKIADYYNEDPGQGMILVSHGINIFVHDDGNDFFNIKYPSTPNGQITFDGEFIYSSAKPRIAMTAIPATLGFYNCFLDFQTNYDINGTYLPIYVFGNVTSSPGGLKVIEGFCDSSVITDLLDDIGSI